jgi:hypothetical protein
MNQMNQLSIKNILRKTTLLLSMLGVSFVVSSMANASCEKLEGMDAKLVQVIKSALDDKSAASPELIEFASAVTAIIKAEVVADKSLEEFVNKKAGLKEFYLSEKLTEQQLIAVDYKVKEKNSKEIFCSVIGKNSDGTDKRAFSTFEQAVNAVANDMMPIFDENSDSANPGDSGT